MVGIFWFGIDLFLKQQIIVIQFCRFSLNKSVANLDLLHFYLPKLISNSSVILLFMYPFTKKCFFKYVLILSAHITFCQSHINKIKSPHDTLWARIARNVKKPPLTVNVIDFDFFGFNGSLRVPWSPLGPKKSWYIGRINRIKKTCGEKQGAFCSILRFHWNHYIDFPDFSDVSQYFYTKMVNLYKT